MKTVITFTVTGETRVQMVERAEQILEEFSPAARIVEMQANPEVYAMGQSLPALWTGEVTAVVG